eukprot:10660021-Alexandrium_andersonii.AAC.1
MVSRAALMSVAAAKAARSLGGLTAHRARARTSLTVTELGGKRRSRVIACLSAFIIASEG